MICQACQCTTLSLDGGDLCDPHQEREDEGRKVRRKSEPKITRPRGSAALTLADMGREHQRAVVRAAVREVMAERKLKPAPKPRCSAVNATGWPCLRAAKYGGLCFTHRQFPASD